MNWRLRGGVVLPWRVADVAAAAPGRGVGDAPTWVGDLVSTGGSSKLMAGARGGKSQALMVVLLGVAHVFRLLVGADRR